MAWWTNCFRPDASVQSGWCSTLAKDEEQHSRLEIPSVALRETSGRTPDEIETASRLVSKLEGKL